MRKVFGGRFGTQNVGYVQGTQFYCCKEKQEKMSDDSKPNFDEFKSDVFSLGMSYLVSFMKFTNEDLK